MKIVLVSCAVLLLVLAVVGLLVVILRGRNAKSTKVPLETQIQAFEQLGIKLNPGIKMEEMLDLWSRETLESDPYRSLYCAFGSSREVDPDTHFSIQIWYFDIESLIEGIEYDRLLTSIGRISGGELRFSSIKTDYQDSESDPVVVLTFDLNGNHNRWTIHPYSDWGTPAFLAPLNEHARKQGLHGRLVWNRSGGDDWALGWHTPQRILDLLKLGVDIVEVAPGVTARPLNAGK